VAAKDAFVRVTHETGGWLTMTARRTKVGYGPSISVTAVFRARYRSSAVCRFHVLRDRGLRRSFCEDER
jgi:hypothetical protein